MSEQNTIHPLLTQATDIDAVINNPSVPKLYANGFTFAHSLSDASIVVQLGKNPIAVLNLSFTTLKTLYNSLGELIPNIEKGMGQKFLDMKETSIVWQSNINKQK